MVARRRWGERIGWLGGWLGSFCWLPAIAAVFAYRGEWGRALPGLLLALIALLLVVRLVPWRFPNAPYWRLMLPLYGLLLPAVGWAVWAFGGWAASGLSGWNALLLLPILSPLLVLGRRRWVV